MPTCNFFNYSLPYKLHANNFPFGNYWNFDFRCANGHTLLKLLLEYVVLFFVISPSCYVEGHLLCFYIHILQPIRASHVGFWNLNHGCYNNTCKMRKWLWWSILRHLLCMCLNNTHSPFITTTPPYFHRSKDHCLLPINLVKYFAYA
jgi:hypothetical protein